MNPLIEKYNKLIERNKKAEKYLNNPNTPVKDAEKWIPTFNLIAIEIFATQCEIESYIGRKMTYDEIWNGFKEGVHN